MNEALMRSAVDNIRAILVDPHDEGARSNLVWLATMAENRILKLGKKTDFQCHILEHSLGAYTFLQPRRWSCRTASRLLPSYRKGWDQKVCPFC